MDYKYNAIILEKRDVGEADRLYTFYAKESGRTKALGKGVRRPNAKLAGNLEPITQSEIFIAKSRGLGKITGAISVENFPHIKTDIEALEKIGAVFKVFNKIVGEQEQDENIFAILLGFLKGMEKLSSEENGANKMDILVLGFLFKLLSEMGYRLEVERCVHCAKKLEPADNYFSPAKGGVLCRDCHQQESKRIKISPEAIKLIRIFLKNKMESLAKLQVAQKDVNNLKIVAQEAVNWL